MFSSVVFWRRPMAAAVTLGALLSASAWAQDAASVPTGAAASSSAAVSSSAAAEVAETNVSRDALPEAPSALLVLQDVKPYKHGQEVIQPKNPPKDGTEPKIANVRMKYIPAGEAYYRLGASDKIYIGLRDTVSLGDIGDWFLASGWSQITNGQPHYGTDRGAYGERLGAAAINETAEGVLDDSVFAVMFKEDPRYFVEGPQHDLFHRTLHAVSRVVITRNDNGSHGPNLALFASYAAVHGIDMTFYPQEDRTAGRYMQGLGGSMVGAALGYGVDEFLPDLLEMVHLKKKS